MPTLVAPAHLIAEKTSSRNWQAYVSTVVIAAFSVVSAAIIFAWPVTEPALMTIAGP